MSTDHSCAECSATVDADAIEEAINGDTYRFCGPTCRDAFEDEYYNQQYGVSGLSRGTKSEHDDPRNKYRHNLRDLLKDPEIAEADKHAAVEYLRAIDPDTYSEAVINDDGQQETKSVGTLHSYTHNLKRVAQAIQTPLTDIDSADDLNRFFDRVATGDHAYDSIKDDGYSEGTLKGWQSAMSKFYQYHDGHDVEPHRITIAKQDDSHVDERDMFTVEEVNALRDACDNPRDRCVLELLLNTGQRIRAIQTLRVKDVDPENGVYWLNTDAEGLKGADKNGGKRPLLGAKQAVFDWLEYHPDPEPDAALITNGQAIPAAPRANRSHSPLSAGLSRK